jgi:hypothetical protein
VDALRAQPGYQSVAPGPRHWQIFTRLCQSRQPHPGCLSRRYGDRIGRGVDHHGSGVFPLRRSPLAASFGLAVCSLWGSS